MLEMVLLGIDEVFWYISRITQWISNSNSFKVVFFLGVAISILFVAFKIIKSAIWGR